MATNSPTPESEEQQKTKRRKRTFDLAPEMAAIASVPLNEDQRARLLKAQQYAALQTTIYRNSAAATVANPIVPIVTPMSVPNQSLASDFLSIQQDRAMILRAILVMGRLYVGSIPFDQGEDVVRQAFLPFGPIRSVSLSYEGGQSQHKGFGFVEYECGESALMAIDQMGNATITGRQIKIGRPNNAPAALAQVEKVQQMALKYPRIFVSSIHLEITEAEIKHLFAAFGEITSCEFPRDPLNPGKPRGYCFLTYDTEANALEAVNAMNRFILAGLVLRVCRAISPPLDPILGVGHVPSISLSAAVTSAKQQVTPITISSQQATKAKEATAAAAVASAKTTSSTSASTTTLSSSSSAKDIMINNSNNNNNNNIHGDENVSISGLSARMQLMQKLARPDEGKNRVVILRNMVTVDEYDEDLKDEVKEECSKIGKVETLEIFLDPISHEIRIYVLFVDEANAETAMKALDGRYFAGRNISASLFNDEKFKRRDFAE